jgi:hypothetical protein
MVALLNVHPFRLADLRTADEMHTGPALQIERFIDSFGNRCVASSLRRARFA